MASKFHRVMFRGVLFALSLCLSAAANAQYAYDIFTLGAYTPNGINNRGQVVGGFYDKRFGQYHAFEYSNGQIRDLTHKCWRRQIRHWDQ